MQTISDDLAALLTSELQAGDSGFRGRIEVDTPVPGYTAAVALIQQAHTSSSGMLVNLGAGDAVVTLPATPTPGDLLVLWCYTGGSAPTLPAGFTVDVSYATVDYCRAVMAHRIVQAGDGAIWTVVAGTGPNMWFAIQEWSGLGEPLTPATDHLLSTGGASFSLSPTGTGPKVLGFFAQYAGGHNAGEVYWTATGATTDEMNAVPDGSVPGGACYVMIASADAVPLTANRSWPGQDAISIGAVFPSLSYAATVSTTTYAAKRIDTDESLNLGAGQMAVEFANEDLPLGWAGSSVFPTNSRIRSFEWYGDVANAVRTFTGIIDKIADSRDPLTTVIACRDMTAILIDQTHTAIGPQGAEEDGAVRTEANGVYLSREVDYVVNDFLDRAGWPTADRAITPTSYVLSEFIIADGESYAAAIIGDDKLTGLVGYDFWADELGIAHFAPSLAASALTETAVPVYTFRTGVDIMSLSDATDQYDLRTRVKVRGPMTTQTPTDVWRELWRTSKIKYPVGIWYDPSDAANIRVLDSGTRRLYKLRDADQVVLSSTYLGTVIPYPLGVSGDPADASVYWVLNAPWKYTGATTGNSVKKVTKATNAVAASYSLPNGRWTALKVSSGSLWLTNWDTDRLYKRSKADGTAVADYSHSVGGVTQTNPSGLMIDGTTLHVFWTNSGTTARFLVCDESAPGTITKVIATAGTTLHGGEMNTTDHVTCWGDSDSLHLVAKFTLIDYTAVTAEVFAEVVDTALEDELGALAQTEPRIHDTHPGDPAHPWMIRRDTLTLEAVISLPQATDTAARRLDKLAHRSRVLDVGILGNPALQRTDLVRVEDPVTGIGENWLIDTHRSGMSDNYVGTLALLPVVSPGDVVTDEGDAT